MLTVANIPHEKAFIFQLSGAVSLLTGQSSTRLERERLRARRACRGGEPEAERQKTAREKARKERPRLKG